MVSAGGVTAAVDCQYSTDFTKFRFKSSGTFPGTIDSDGSNCVKGQAIGKRLQTSRHTVKAQAISVYRKLDFTSRNATVKRVRHLGLI